MRAKLSLSLWFLAAVALGPRAGAASRGVEVELPRQVPSAKVTQQVGLTEIGVEYDCPAAQGRKVWGGLVPYDRPWTIAANPASRIKFSQDVTIADKVVPAGTYWLLATPGKSTWTFMLNKSPDNVAQPRDYKPELDVVRIKVASKVIPRRERLTFLFSDLTEEHASLDLEWDTLRVSLPIRVNTNQQIEAALGGLDNSWRSFANAARYMLETKKDYDAGLKYIDESLALQAVEHVQDWYCLWIKGALLAAKGQFTQAQELAQNAYDLANKTGGGFYLEPELAKTIADWRRRATEKGHVAAASPAKFEAKVEPKAQAKVEGKGEDKAPPPFVVAPAVEAPRVKESVGAAHDSGPSKPAEHEAAALTNTSPPVGDPPPMRRARLRHR
jgi:Protein of unknown function (DUF2911)